MITNTSFRADFPEFSSTPDYPASMLNYYNMLGSLLINKRRFGNPSPTVSTPPNNMYDMALELFMAHHIVLERRAQIAAKNGGVPGESVSAIASKNTGPISVSYENAESLDKNAGHWNDTEYGKRFWKLIQLFGAGVIQVGVGRAPMGEVFNGVPLNGPAWPGLYWLMDGSIN